MYWMDLGIDRRLTDVDVQRGWAKAFGIPAGAVAVTPNWGDLERWARPGIRVAVARMDSEGAGDFPMMLSVVLQDDAMEARVETDQLSIDAVQRFCMALNCRAIMSSESDDQSSWTLVSPSARWRVRGYDPDQEGDRLVDAILEPLAVVVA